MSVLWRRYIRHFRPVEFDSPDAPGTGATEMNVEFVRKLDEVRERCGFPLVVSSGYRTDAHNRRVGGVDSSSHCRGRAADIRALESVRRFTIVHEALRLGFRRIGIGSTFVHLDDDPDLPAPVMWTY